MQEIGHTYRYAWLALCNRVLLQVLHALRQSISNKRPKFKALYRGTEDKACSRTQVCWLASIWKRFATVQALMLTSAIECPH